MTETPKTHKLVVGPDCRGQGQSQFEFTHTTLCGYVRNLAAFPDEDVTCKICLKELAKLNGPLNYTLLN